MIREKLESLRNGSLTAEQNVINYLDNIKRSNDGVNAFIHYDEKRVFEDTREVDRKISEGTAGSLAGLVVAVKSNINVKGYRVTCSSKTLENYVSPYDAEVIKRIRSQDGIVIGMTNMDEFACGSSGETGYYGVVKNPTVPDYICGGSSSGSAAAVAANMCDLALGSDTGGSIRNPSSHCGIVGVKSTYGLVPREGLIDLAMSLDQIGPLSKDVFGSALLLDTIAGENPRECTTVKRDPASYTDELEKDVRGYKVGVCKKFFDVTDSRISGVVYNALDKMESECGVETVDIDLPYVEDALVAYYPIVFVEFFSATRKFDGRRYGYKIEDVCGEEVGRRIFIGSYISQKEVIGKYYNTALKLRGVIKDAFDQAFNKCDTIIGPTVPKLPHKVGEKVSPLEMYAYDLLTVPANLAGVCAGVVPAGRVDGIPIGMQVHADKNSEKKMFQIMISWEKLNKVSSDEI